ncbi:class I SAM-dependent methyltransferase [Candidatus Synechococcus calcipolaris G9]|uniref:Class I SAM-dependent methyltransferase n=1 Tax=Candidatus Synechococcus calcipolaris G9 TaxID=1497997 RepID=A0ABT6EY84_9SYNE|nr:class I SAM-dependent methyltransferase [Candidatus Synechococcus calcipolaris]MDG2990518.1 class I SAM-dependent methyltransferase [Candidatus Synechococcus calcipolaris G9]
MTFQFNADSQEQESLGRSPADLGVFFSDTWQIYQKILLNNHMHHKELYALVQSISHQQPHPFEMLDLGCGDASYTATALRNSPIQAYTGVDVSPVALEIAAHNLASLSIPIQLIEKSFIEFIDENQKNFDLILMSFALHHLDLTAKDQFLGKLLPRLNPGGTFILIDVFRQEGESLPAYYDRYIQQAHKSGWKLTPSEFITISDHIISSDLPDSIATITMLIQSHGCQNIDCLFLSHDTTIGLLKINH